MAKRGSWGEGQEELKNADEGVDEASSQQEKAAAQSATLRVSSTIQGVGGHVVDGVRFVTIANGKDGGLQVSAPVTHAQLDRFCQLDGFSRFDGDDAEWGPKIDAAFKALESTMPVVDGTNAALEAQLDDMRQANLNMTKELVDLRKVVAQLQADLSRLRGGATAAAA